MGISSDVFITRIKAEKMVKSKLEFDYSLIIDSAVKGMDDDEEDIE